MRSKEEIRVFRRGWTGSLFALCVYSSEREKGREGLAKAGKWQI